MLDILLSRGEATLSYHHWLWTLQWYTRLQGTWLSSCWLMLWDTLTDWKEQLMRFNISNDKSSFYVYHVSVTSTIFGAGFLFNACWWWGVYVSSAMPYKGSLCLGYHCSFCAETLRCSWYLRCVRKLPLAWPEPSQPGVGQVGPSVLKAFQEKGVPLRRPSFCRRAASGQP